MKRNIENIKRELKVRGIQSEQVHVVKNGVSFDGLRIDNGTNISPVVYWSPGESMEDFVAKIGEALRRPLDISAEYLTDREYLLRNIYVSVQKVGNETHLIKRKVMNLEAILRVKVNILKNGEIGSFKVTDELLKASNISTNEAWDCAIGNMANEFIIKSLDAIFGFPEEKDSLFYIVTTKNCVDGASALLYPQIFRNFCRKKGVESVLILPSSTEEVLIVQEAVDIGYANFAQMVKEVNNTAVARSQQLDPVVYRYDIKSNCIQIVADA